MTCSSSTLINTIGAASHTTQAIGHRWAYSSHRSFVMHPKSMLRRRDDLGRGCILDVTDLKLLRRLCRQVWLGSKTNSALSLVMAPLLWQNMQRELLRVEAAASRAGEGPFMTTLPAAYQKCILSHPHTTFRAGKGPFMTTLPLLCKNANCNTLARPHPLNH
eukprot:1142190-Pelagomonas_calceolata.AAC.4